LQNLPTPPPAVPPCKEDVARYIAQLADELATLAAENGLVVCARALETAALAAAREAGPNSA
jgi:hypothetical protein